MTTRRVSIVVVNYASAAELVANFRGLDLDALDASLIVVDNGGDAPEHHRLLHGTAADAGWVLLTSPANVGFGAAVNAGVARGLAAGVEALLVVNPDVQLTTSSAVALTSRSLAMPNTMFAPRIDRLDGRPWFRGAVVDVHAGTTSTRHGADSTDPGGWLTGACFSMSSILWKRVGGFDDAYFLYWEDVDLSWRVVASGGSLMVVEDVRVQHRVGGSQASDGKSPAYIYFNCRNRLLFATKHLTRREATRWAARSVWYARRVLLRGGRRALVRNWPRAVSAAVGGTVAGLAATLRPVRAEL